MKVAKQATKGEVNRRSPELRRSGEENQIRANVVRPVRLWRPRIGKISINAKQRLLSVIVQEYPRLRRKPRFRQLLTDAERHLNLNVVLRSASHLQHGDLRRLALLTGLTAVRVHRYVRYGHHPQLYRLIEAAISKTEARTRLGRIHQTNCGIGSTREVERRIDTYYPGEAFASSRAYDRNLGQVTLYFKCLELLKDGGLLGDVAKKLHVDSHQVRGWFRNDKRPYLVKLASQIPRKGPGLANKWLPTKVKPGHGFQPEHFVRVPAMVTDWRQIRRVMRQLVPLTNARMRRWRVRFGDSGQECSFAYLLGMMVSDAGKREKGFTSTGLQLKLSKAYPWSERVGEATCCCLGLIGIKTRRCELSELSRTSRTAHFWYSEESPILRWMVRSCLGLRTGECTTYNPIEGGWLLNAPDSVRLGFLQGLADGDGSASVKTQRITIACGCNIEFVKRLLKTFGIHCTECGHQIVIARRESILRAVGLPFFKHAQGRQDTAQKIAAMFRARMREQHCSLPMEVAAQMLDLREYGRSYGEIAEMVFDQRGLSYGISTVISAVRRQREQNKREPSFVLADCGLQ